MAEEPKQHRVVVDHRMSLETLATVRADLSMVVELGGLRQALKENRQTIIVKSSGRLPLWLFSILVFFYVVVYQAEISFRGLTLGYNIESCQHLTVKGIGDLNVDLSNCVKLTRPDRPR